MAKKIFCTEEDIRNFLQSAAAQLHFAENELKKRKFQNGRDKEIRLNFVLDDTKDHRKAILVFSQKAWIKMYALINNFQSEVEWHGTVERINASSFKISDILIFPHTATGATVTSNQQEYEAWLDSLDDDTFNALRFHGHSHVDMGVTPSSVDETYRNKVLNNFGTPNDQTDLFYIFLIANKKGAISAEIYDLQNNALYDTEEIVIDVESDDDETLRDFVIEAKETVKTNTQTYYSGSGYSGATYGGNNGNASTGNTYNSPTSTASQSASSNEKVTTSTAVIRSPRKPTKREMYYQEEIDLENDEYVAR